MTAVVFARAFRRHVTCPSEQVDDVSTVAEALDEYFRRHPLVRGYVVDEAGRFRRHVTVFVDDDQVTHAEAAVTPVAPATTVHIFQALSGG